MVIAFVSWDDKKGDSCFEDTHRWQEEGQCQQQRDITDPIIGRKHCQQCEQQQLSTKMSRTERYN